MLSRAGSIYRPSLPSSAPSPDILDVNTAHTNDSKQPQQWGHGHGPTPDATKHAKQQQGANENGVDARPAGAAHEANDGNDGNDLTTTTGVIGEYVGGEGVEGDNDG